MHWIINFDNNKGPKRVNQACVGVKSKIYSFGGYSKETTTQFLKTKTPIDINCLNIQTLEWTQIPTVSNTNDPQYDQTPYFRYGHTCVNHNDIIYIWGGRADWTDLLCNNVFSYNPCKFNFQLLFIN
jgi:N-acetylneuraminic acid mutarotase